MPAPPEPGFRPTPHFRTRRRRGMARVAMIDGSGRERLVIVRDVSERGLSAAIQSDPPAPDAIVGITLPDGRLVWGLVRWVDRNLFGVEFDGALGPAPAPAPAPSRYS